MWWEVFCVLVSRFPPDLAVLNDEAYKVLDFVDYDEDSNPALGFLSSSKPIIDWSRLNVPRNNRKSRDQSYLDQRDDAENMIKDEDPFLRRKTTVIFAAMRTENPHITQETDAETYNKNDITDLTRKTINYPTTFKETTLEATSDSSSPDDVTESQKTTFSTIWPIDSQNPTYTNNEVLEPAKSPTTYTQRDKPIMAVTRKAFDTHATIIERTFHKADDLKELTKSTSPYEWLSELSKITSTNEWMTDLSKTTSLIEWVNKVKETTQTQTSTISEESSGPLNIVNWRAINAYTTIKGKTYKTADDRTESSTISSFNDWLNELHNFTFNNFNLEELLNASITDYVDQSGKAVTWKPISTHATVIDHTNRKADTDSGTTESTFLVRTFVRQGTEMSTFTQQKTDLITEGKQETSPTNTPVYETSAAEGTASTIVMPAEVTINESQIFTSREYFRRRKKTTTVTTTPVPTTTISYYFDHKHVDPERLMALFDYVIAGDVNRLALSQRFNETLQKFEVPTCGFGRNETTTEPPSTINFNDAPVVAKCFVCGLNDTMIPYTSACADAFAGDFIPLVPLDPKARGQIAKFRKYCRYLDANRIIVNEEEPHSVFGRFTGGCSVRWVDLTNVYTQRACRNRRRAVLGQHFASKRMAKLEMALNDVDNGCIISPMATLLPVSRGVSLYARFHACVCTGSWCNGAVANEQWIANIVVMLVVLIFGS